MTKEALKFPIGPYNSIENPSSEQINEWTEVIEKFPILVQEITDMLSSDQLSWRYRPDGWTIKQVVHHCADSHMNSLIRFKLALTEENPTIKPYYEDRWANLPDSITDEIDESLTLLHGLHQKWSRLLKSLTESQLKKCFVHPETGATISLAENIGLYAWHCNHHLQHIKNAVHSKGSFA